MLIVVLVAAYLCVGGVFGYWAARSLIGGRWQGEDYFIGGALGLVWPLLALLGGPVWLVRRLVEGGSDG